MIQRTLKKISSQTEEIRSKGLNIFFSSNKFNYFPPFTERETFLHFIPRNVYEMFMNPEHFCFREKTSDFHQPLNALHFFF